MSAPGFYENRDASKPVIDRHQALMWEVGDLMAQWEALQEHAAAAIESSLRIVSAPFPADEIGVYNYRFVIGTSGVSTRNPLESAHLLARFQGSARAQAFAPPDRVEVCFVGVRVMPSRVRDLPDGPVAGRLRPGTRRRASSGRRADGRVLPAHRGGHAQRRAGDHPRRAPGAASTTRRTGFSASTPQPDGRRTAGRRRAAATTRTSCAC